MADDNPDVPTGKKRFIPLAESINAHVSAENNPEVMSSLVHKLGLSDKLAFHDVFSIDEPELLAFVPRPAHALLLVFPVSGTYEKFRRQEDGDMPEYEGHEPNSDLAKLIQDAIPLKPAERADLLYESEALESAHQSAAGGGDTSAPNAEDNIDLHYVCFVKSADNNLWEMDGRRKGPINRGKLSADEDVLSEKALDLGVRSFLKRESEAGGGDLRFSLITLAESLD
ncbi:ubiquitinyl hydrolase 1 [Nothophoma quercina]|uniref:Ubiquitin carboxyl-terminal hydrolase n=1 Tax=Nothophoma quercina TaxID=749835 RepID=A0ABR3RMM2_9PLEO